MWNAIAVVVMCVSVATTAGLADARDRSGPFKASELIGMKVLGTDGKTLGDIKDLVINPDDGAIDYAVLDFGGFLGIKDKYFAIPWDALQVTSDKGTILIDATRRDLKNAPGFDKNHWPDFGDLAQTTVIYEFYGVPVPNVSGEHKITR
jgi:sporulation protein YlmC with PRC-barrel domain